MLVAHYLKNGWRYRLRYYGAPIGNGTWVIKWSCDHCCFVTLKDQGGLVAHIYLDANILESSRDSIRQTPCSMNIILLNLIS